MEPKAFKKPPNPLPRNNPMLNGETVNERKDDHRGSPLRKPCGAFASSMSVGSDENKGICSKSGHVRMVDLNEWEYKAKKAMREFCISNGLDIKKFYVDNEKKKMAVAQKSGIPRVQVQNVNKLLPIFKALDTLMLETRFPPGDILQLLKPLVNSFLVKQSASYWHLMAKAAVASGDYSLGVELLERGTKCGAQPLMEMQRAYGAVCRKLVNVIKDLSAEERLRATTPVNDISEGNNELNGFTEEPEGDGDNSTVESQNGNNVEANGGNENEVDQQNDANGAEQENTETEGVDTAAEYENEDKAPDNLPLDDVVMNEIGLNHEERDAVVLNEQNAHVELADPIREVGEQLVGHAPGLEDQNESMKVSNGHNGINDNEKDIGLADTAMAPPQQAGLDDAVGDGSDIDEVPELPVSLATPAASRRRENRKTGVDEGAIFKSSAKKLVMVENKSAKKQKGANENVPPYHVTPVRRSTRKGTGYDKWMTYRNAAVDSPNEFQQVDVDAKNALFKKNPYLFSDEDSD